MPIECSCPACNKQFRVKDELAGRKFKCTECGAVVAAGPLPSTRPNAPASGEQARPRRPATPAASPSASEARKPVSEAARKKRASSVKPESGTRPTKKKRPAKKRVRRKPDPFDDDYRDADPDDLFGGDFGDDYGEPIDNYGDDFGDDPYSSPPPRKKKKKTSAPTKTKSKRKKKSGGGLSIGFNLNRINIALVVGGVVLLIYGTSEARLAAQSNSAPVPITLAELLQNRPDSIYLTVSGVISSEGGYIAEESTAGRLKRIWAPAHPPGSPNANFILYSTKPRSEGDADMLLSQTSFTGMITNDIRSLGREEKNLLKTIPGVNVDTAIIFEIGREPSSWLGVILYFIAGLAVMAGGAAWIFLTGSD